MWKMVDADSPGRTDFTAMAGDLENGKATDPTRNEQDCLVNELRQSIAEMPGSNKIQRESVETQRQVRFYNMSSGEDRHGRPRDDVEECW